EMETILPFRSRGRSTAEVVSELLGAHAAGIHNALCLDGGRIDSLGLIHLVSQLNRGRDVGGNPLGSQTALLAGVSVNPATLDVEQELRRLEAMVKAGAEFIVTEPVFDADALESFLKRTEEFRLPAIVGIRPLRNFC